MTGSKDRAQELDVGDVEFIEEGLADLIAEDERDQRAWSNALDDMKTRVYVRPYAARTSRATFPTPRLVRTSDRAPQS